jgi:hypothetical protein
MLTKAYFIGNAPEMGSDVFAYTPEDFTIYYNPNTTGWSSPEWNGYPAYPEAEDTIIARGTCGADGDNLTWVLDDTGTLTISGGYTVVCGPTQGDTAVLDYDRSAIITGVNRLVGARVNATDLRAGAAMVIAGLMAEGVTEIGGVGYILRGYENIDKKLMQLGARIERIQVEKTF